MKFSAYSACLNRFIKIKQNYLTEVIEKKTNFGTQLFI